MNAVEQVGRDFPVELWVVGEEVTVGEIADIYHGGLLSVKIEKPSH